MTPKERHEEAVKAITSCVCGGAEIGEIFWSASSGICQNGNPRSQKPDRLCNNELPGAYSCSLQMGHAGIHIACGGELGPHAIASWDETVGVTQTKPKKRKKTETNRT